MFGFQIAWRRNLRSILVVWELLRDGLQFMNVVARRRTAVAAEVLFLRKQLAYYRSDFRRMSHTALDPQLFQQF
jgi:hypothetical protein